MSIEIREGPGWGENTIKFKYEHVIALLKTFLGPPLASGIKIKSSLLPPGPVVWPLWTSVPHLYLSPCPFDSPGTLGFSPHPWFCSLLLLGFCTHHSFSLKYVSPSLYPYKDLVHSTFHFSPLCLMVICSEKPFLIFLLKIVPYVLHSHNLHYETSFPNTYHGE